MENKKIILYGASTTGKKALEYYGSKRVVGFIDKSKAGTSFCEKPVITLEEYKAKYHCDIAVCSNQFVAISEELHKEGIFNFELFKGVYMHDDVPMSGEIAHKKWINKLKKIADIEGKEILEIGSRVVTGANFRKDFENAYYTGFDLYEGENVDVVGDAHKLSNYFNKKFDLIFCSAVFEHFAMPWLVADEIIKLLNIGGYVFVETHYSYSSHERPWHFFQYSEQALNILFSEKRGIKCIEKGVSNPLVAFFSEESNEYLRKKNASGLYCHSEFLGQKMREADLDWKKCLEDETFGMYPPKME